jgi:hypothetical protein
MKNWYDILKWWDFSDKSLLFARVHRVMSPTVGQD